LSNAAPKQSDKRKCIAIPNNQVLNTWTSRLEDFAIEDASNQEDISPSEGHMFTRCVHVLELIRNAPKTVDVFFKLKDDKAITPIMKTLNAFLTFQRETRKISSKRLSINERK